MNRRPPPSRILLSLLLAAATVSSVRGGVASAAGTALVGDTAAPETLARFPGYLHPHYQLHDDLFMDAAEAFNREYGFDPGDRGHLDPHLLKAWAIQESGSQAPDSWEIWEQGDLMQVNNPGDWTADKRLRLGLEAEEDLAPARSVALAIQWAYHKGCIYEHEERIPAAKLPSWERYSTWSADSRGVLVPREVDGLVRFFQGWDVALYRYNGNTEPWSTYDPLAPTWERDGTRLQTREWYVRAIHRRLRSAGLEP